MISIRRLFSFIQTYNKGDNKMIPKVNFCGVDISRLIVGGNTISGTSHISAELDAEMEDYFTTQKVKDMFWRCQENGINTMQLRADKHIMRIIREFRLEGGNMHWIAQHGREYGSFEGIIGLMASYKPALMYLHGYSVDEMFKDGAQKEIERMLGIMKKTGIPVGLCTHMPEVIEYSEIHRWNIDFYMASIYNIMVPERMEQSDKVGNEDPLFIDSDIPLMYEAIRGVDKPCLAFKILGSTRRCQSQETVAAAFKECYASIKKNDAAIVGMFPRDLDEVTLNAKYAAEAMK